MFVVILQVDFVDVNFQMIKIIAIVIFISLVSVGKGSVVVEVGVLLPISSAPHLPSDQWVSGVFLFSFHFILFYH